MTQQSFVLIKDKVTWQEYSHILLYTVQTDTSIASHTSCMITWCSGNIAKSIILNKHEKASFSLFEFLKNAVYLKIIMLLALRLLLPEVCQTAAIFNIRAANYYAIVVYT